MLWVGCQKNEAVEPPPQPRPVKTLKINDSGAVKEVEFPGQIRSVQKSWKAFEVSGRVIERLVKEGELVKKGQVLARLDPRDFQYTYDAAKAQQKAALAVQVRKSQLFKKGAVSRQEVDLADRDLLQSSAKLKQAKKALDDTQLIADFDGRVAQLLIDDFTNVVAKENVMMIQNNKLLEVVINIPESAVALPLDGKTTADKVNSTHPVVVFSVLPGEKYDVVYREASERPDPATRTYEVKLTFLPDKKSRVRPGMTAKVRAFIPPNKASRSVGFPVPLHAIISKSENESSVWKINPTTKTVSKVRVTTGATIGDSCVVQRGLKNGDLIAVSGIHQLTEGARVRLWKTESK